MIYLTRKSTLIIVQCRLSIFAVQKIIELKVGTKVFIHYSILIQGHCIAPWSPPTYFCQTLDVDILLSDAIEIQRGGQVALVFNNIHHHQCSCTSQYYLSYVRCKQSIIMMMLYQPKSNVVQRLPFPTQYKRKEYCSIKVFKITLFFKNVINLITEGSRGWFQYIYVCKYIRYPAAVLLSLMQQQTLIHATPVWWKRETYNACWMRQQLQQHYQRSLFSSWKSGDRLHHLTCHIW